MKEWKRVKLGDCIKEVVERTTENNQYQVLSVTKDGILSQEDFFKKQIASENNIGYKVIRRDNLVFSTMNLWMGSLDVLTNYDIGIVSPAYKIFKFNEKLMLPSYGKYFMKSYYMLEQYKNCSEQGASIVRRNLDLKALLNISVNIPLIAEQERVVKILEKVDKIIYKIEEEIVNINTFNNNLLNSIMERKIILRKKNGNNYPDWKEVKLKEIISDYRLGENYKNTIEKNENPLIKMGNLYKGKIKLDKIEYIDKNELIKEKDLLNYGDILFNTRNTPELVGKVAIWRNELKKAYYNSNLLLLNFNKEGIYNNFYMNCVLNSKNVIKKFHQIATGTTSVAAIYTNDLLNVKVKISIDKEEQNRIAWISEQFNKKNNLLLNLRNYYVTMKKGLMQQLLTGKIGAKYKI